MEFNTSAQRVAELAKANQVELMLDCIVELDLSDLLLNKQSVPADVFNWMLRALEASKEEGNRCGFYIFEWFLTNHSKLGQDAMNILKQFVADNYGLYSDGPLLISMAEWIGSQQIDWSISVIEKWLSSPLHERALDSLRLAFEQLEADAPQLPDGTYATLSKLKSAYDLKRASCLGY